MAFGEIIKKLRIKRELSQQDLAIKLGLSKSAISMYERGEREPDFEMLESFADFFNVDINYLLGRTNGSVYYLDPEAAEAAQEMFERPEMKVLFDASRNVSKEDILSVADILKRLKVKQFGDGDD